MLLKNNSLVIKDLEVIGIDEISNKKDIKNIILS